jgi:16S rRNA (cytosine1402-N4)-methyltransferase
MEFKHYSVMAKECMEALDPSRGGIYVDCTAGGGGHSSLIAGLIPPGGGRLIALDRDDEAVLACRERLAPFGAQAMVIKSNFTDVCSVLDLMEIDKIDGIMWDLGVSSRQLDEPSRGFSYMNDAPLDMRMDVTCGRTAYDVVNGYSAEELCRVIRDYGEEKFASRISKAIVSKREQKNIETTLELASVVASAIPEKNRREEKQHPAKRTFQAIRIEVNGELDCIAPSIEAAIGRLNVGGRAAVITFHSLEDRIVKQTFAKLVSPCTCPPDFPVCVCGKKPMIRLLNKKPITPGEEELSENPRSRSAKLRCAERI